VCLSNFLLEMTIFNPKEFSLKISPNHLFAFMALAQYFAKCLDMVRSISIIYIKLVGITG
jgi:hypothetical protein